MKKYLLFLSCSIFTSYPSGNTEIKDLERLSQETKEVEVSFKDRKEQIKALQKQYDKEATSLLKEEIFDFSDIDALTNALFENSERKEFAGIKKTHSENKKYVLKMIAPDVMLRTSSLCPINIEKPNTYGLSIQESTEYRHSTMNIISLALPEGHIINSFAISNDAKKIALITRTTKEENSIFTIFLYHPDESKLIVLWDNLLMTSLDEDVSFAHFNKEDTTLHFLIAYKDSNKSYNYYLNYNL